MIRLLNLSFLLLLISIISSCAKTEAYFETCEDITCSENALCTIINDIPTCACNDGFTGDGSVCTEVNNYSWRKTIGGTKSDYANIIIYDDENNVYIAGSFAGDVDFDSGNGIDIHSSEYLCASDSTTCDPICGLNQECNYDTYECECRKGFHSEEDPNNPELTICIIDVCEISCGGDAICVNGKCECKEGTHLDDYLECIEDFKCSNSCKENSICVNGACECKSGYYKDFSNNSFLTKFKYDGTYLWTKTVFSLNDNKIIDLALKDNTLYLLGKFMGNIDFDPSNGIDIRRGSEENDNTFLLKLTDSGSYIDTTVLEPNDPKSIVINDDDTLYIAGSFRGKIKFLTVLLGLDFFESINDSLDIFLTKLNTDGSYLWTKTIGGGDWDGIESMALDSKGNIYLTGGFNNIVDFNPGAGIDEKTSNGGLDIFVTKISYSGVYEWTKTLGSTSYDYIEDVIVDKNDEVLIIGSFSDILATTEEDGYESNGLADIFVSKLNKNGDFLWTKVFGGPGWEINGSIAVDKENNVYVTGGFMESIILDNDRERISFGGYDIFLAKLDTNGEYIWGRTIAGNNDEHGQAISIDNDNNILITGSFWEDIILETTAESFTSKGMSDIFIFKIK